MPRGIGNLLALDLVISARSGQAAIPFLRRQLSAAHGIIAPPLAELSVALVGDKRMADLHLRYLRIPGPTDVLTFELDHDSRGRVTAGEVIVCVPEAKRRCGKSGVPVRREVLLYALHGMLHLCGFDDGTPRGFARMHRTENDILTRLGVGPVFGRG